VKRVGGRRARCETQPPARSGQHIRTRRSAGRSLRTG
jgi:hypothetical protein